MNKKELDQKYKRSQKGLISKLYWNQVNRTKLRLHDLPAYTKNELKKWVFSHKDFDELYNNWITSDYDKNLTPSIDRIDDTKSYTFDNIRLVTWKVNNAKGRKSKSIKIKAINKNTKDVFYYKSLTECALNINAEITNISKCILGKRKTTKGYYFEKI